VGEPLTISLVDSNGAVLDLTGDVIVTFSGLANGLEGSVATIKNKYGAAKTLGATTTLAFTNGVLDSASGAGTLVAYKAESATLNVTDGTRSSTSTGGMGLSLAVSPTADSAYRLTGTGSPQVGVD